MARKMKWVMPTDEQGRPIVDPYLRMSDGFDGKQDNRQNQLDDIMPLFEENGWALGEVLQDEVSAWKRGVKRDDFETLLIRVETGLSAGAAFYDQDRFLRRPMDLERFLLLWEDGREGLIVASMYGPINLNDGNARLNMRQAAAVAMKQSDDTSRRARRKNAGKRKRGVLIKGGPRPFAWPGKGADPELVEREQKALRAAFDYILVGGKGGLTEIARRWNAAGLRGYYGNDWNPITVRQTMSKQRHAGRIEHDGEVVGVIADHKPTIESTTFDRVQEVFMSRQRGRPAGKTNLASGIIHCSHCGAPMTSRPRYRSNGEAVPSYRCNPPRGCNRLQIDQEPVDKMLRALTIRRLSDPEVAKRVSKIAAKQGERIEEVRAQLGTAREVEVMLSAKVGAGQMTPDAFSAAHGPTFERIKALEAELAELEAAAADLGATETQTRIEVAQEWDTAQAEGDTERLRRMLKAALRQVCVEILPAEQGRMTPPEKRIRVRRIGGIHNTNADAGVGPDSK